MILYMSKTRKRRVKSSKSSKSSKLRKGSRSIKSSRHRGTSLTRRRRKGGNILTAIKSALPPFLLFAANRKLRSRGKNTKRRVIGLKRRKSNRKWKRWVKNYKKNRKN